MALIPCPECKQQINETVESCPQCGYILTPEEVARIKKRRREWKISFIIMGAAVMIGIVVISIVVISTELQQSRMEVNYQKRTKSSTGTSTYSSQPQRPKTTQTQSASAPVMSAPKPSELQGSKTQQEQDAENKAWFGTWSLETMDGEPTGQYLAEDLQSEHLCLVELDVLYGWEF